MSEYPDLVFNAHTDLVEYIRQVRAGNDRWQALSSAQHGVLLDEALTIAEGALAHLAEVLDATIAAPPAHSSLAQVLGEALGFIGEQADFIRAVTAGISDE